MSYLTVNNNKKGNKNKTFQHNSYSFSFLRFFENQVFTTSSSLVDYNSNAPRM